MGSVPWRYLWGGMAFVRVIALQEFACDGRMVYPGQAVQMAAIDAAVRARQGQVSLDPGMRETYQTRDMVAMSAPVVTVVVAPAVVVPTKITRRRRRKSA